MKGKKTTNKFRLGNLRAKQLIRDVGRDGWIILKTVTVNLKLNMSLFNDKAI